MRVRYETLKKAINGWCTVMAVVHGLPRSSVLLGVYHRASKSLCRDCEHFCILAGGSRYYDHVFPVLNSSHRPFDTADAHQQVLHLMEVGVLSVCF